MSSKRRKGSDSPRATPTRNGHAPSASNRHALFSPFPFGSPIANSTRSLLSPGPNPEVTTTMNGSRLDETGNASRAAAAGPGTATRLRGSDLYGGQVMFGGASASQTSNYLRRSNRLLASTPYQAALNRRRPNASAAESAQTNGANESAAETKNASTSPKPTTNQHNTSMSSTAQTILNTLERMSTPLRDAQKIPVAGPARAERRRLIAEELLESSSSNVSRARRSVSRTGGGNGGLLSGPPLRSIRSTATPAAAAAAAHVKRHTYRGAAAASPSVAEPPRSAVAPTKSAAALTPSGPRPTQLAPRSDAFRAAAAAPASGKIRAKVGDKARMRAEKVLNEEEADVPSFLPSQTVGLAAANPLAKIELGAFSLGGQKSTLKPTDSGIFKPGLSSPARGSATTTSSTSSAFGQSLPAAKPSAGPSFNFSAPAPLTKPAPAISAPLLPPASNGSPRQQFSFSKPDFVRNGSASPSSSAPAAASFKFSGPEQVAATSGKKLPTSGVTSAYGMQRMATMPDVTSPSKSIGGVGGLKMTAAAMKAGGLGGSKLPDVTAGLGPAKTLKMGSVMDILGKTSGTDGWKKDDPKVGGNKPW